MSQFFLDDNWCKMKPSKRTSQQHNGRNASGKYLVLSSEEETKMSALPAEERGKVLESTQVISSPEVLAGYLFTSMKKMFTPSAITAILTSEVIPTSMVSSSAKRKLQNSTNSSKKSSRISHLNVSTKNTSKKSKN